MKKKEENVISSADQQNNGKAAFQERDNDQTQTTTKCNCDSKNKQLTSENRLQNAEIIDLQLKIQQYEKIVEKATATMSKLMTMFGFVLGKTRKIIGSVKK